MNSFYYLFIKIIVEIAFLEEDINEILGRSLVCSKVCLYYKTCVDDLLKLDEKNFIDFYVRFNNSLEQDNVAMKKIDEYIDKYFPNKNVFFSKIITQIKTQYLENILYEEQESIIRFLLRNSDFLSFVNQYIKDTNSNLLNNWQIKLFEEINFLLYLSWINKDYDIFSDKFFSEKISNNLNSPIVDLFESYNKIINYYLNLSNNKQIENIIYLLVNLFDIINNSIFVSNIIFSWNWNIWLITQKLKLIIENIKNTIWDNQKFSDTIKLLDNSAWKIDIIFTHLKVKENIVDDLEAKNIDNILLKYDNILSEHIDGFNKMQSSNFWNWRTPERSAYNVFLWNSSVAILDLINLLKDFPEDFILSNPLFQKIINKYFDSIVCKKNNKLDFESLKLDLLHNIFLIYSSDDLKEEWTCIVKDKFLDDFVMNFLSKDKLNQDEIESLYHIVRFSNIDKNLLVKIWEYLVSTTFSSYYYEEFKIKTLSVIIKQLSWNFDNDIFTFVNKVIKYIESNKVASHLIQSYSDIYLYTSFYCTYSENPEIKNKSLEYYHKFKQIKWNIDNLCDLDIKYILEEIIYNVWLNQVQKYWIVQSNREKLIEIWKISLKEWEEWFYDKLENSIFDKINTIINKNLNWIDIDFDLWKEIINILSTYVFKWFCDISIVHDSKKKLEKRKWYNHKEEILYDGYKIHFTYPVIHEKIFLEIFEKEWWHILNNIKTIIITNIQKKELEYDKVTGFLNEAKFLSDIEKTNDIPTSIMILRITNIWYINKWYSHELWDKYLAQVALILEKKLSPIVNTFYRWNGANFMLNLKTGFSKEEIEKYISNLSLEKVLLNWLNFSIATTFWSVLDEVWDIHKKAMIAIDIAKRHKEKSCFFDEKLVDKLSYKKNMEILYSVEEAIKEDRIVPYFQPIMDLKTGNIYKYEALVRMIDKDTWKPIPPWVFLPVIEDHWKLWDITHIIIEKSFKILSERNISLSINITADDLKNPNFLRFIDEISSKYKIDTNSVTLELLESAFSWDIKIMLKALKDRWFKIAMDDYWADFSNLNRFLDLTYNGLLDYLKIDWEVIKKLREDKDWIISTILKWTIDAVHKSWVKVVAEFVEDETLVTKLTDLEIDYGQGYFYSPPISEEKMKKYFWH